MTKTKNSIKKIGIIMIILIVLFSSVSADCPKTEGHTCQDRISKYIEKALDYKTEPNPSKKGEIKELWKDLTQEEKENLDETASELTPCELGIGCITEELEPTPNLDKLAERTTELADKMEERGLTIKEEKEIKEISDILMEGDEEKAKEYVKSKGGNLVSVPDANKGAEFAAKNDRKRCITTECMMALNPTTLSDDDLSRVKKRLEYAAVNANTPEDEARQKVKVFLINREQKDRESGNYENKKAQIDLGESLGDMASLGGIIPSSASNIDYSSGGEVTLPYNTGIPSAVPEGASLSSDDYYQQYYGDIPQVPASSGSIPQVSGTVESPEAVAQAPGGLYGNMPQPIPDSTAESMGSFVPAQNSDGSWSLYSTDKATGGVHEVSNTNINDITDQGQVDAAYDNVDKQLAEGGIETEDGYFEKNELVDNSVNTC